MRQLWKRFTNWLKGDKPPKNPLPLESFEFHGPKNLTLAHFFYSSESIQLLTKHMNLFIEFMQLHGM